MTKDEAIEQFGEQVVELAESYYETNYDKFFWQDLDDDDKLHYLWLAYYQIKRNIPLYTPR